MNHYPLTYTSNPFLRGNAYGYWKNKAKTSLYYSTFGAPMPGLTYTSSTAYRFGFNGQEKDDEIAGKGNHTTAEFWEYDARLGRRWNLDPKPNPSISGYACFANNPIWNNDQAGDSIKTTQEGFNIINEGLTATLGDKSPFGYDKDKGALTFNSEFDRTKLNTNQLELIDRYAAMVTSEKDIVNVLVVDYFEEIEELQGSLKYHNANGITLPYSVKENGIEVGTIQDIYIARNPQVKDGTNAFGEVNYTEARPYYRGLATIHEIAGHAYLRATQPNLPKEKQNEQVEEYENKIRKFYKYEGFPIKGFAVKH